MICDNESVVKSTLRAESTLTKKYHWRSVREAISAGWLRIATERIRGNEPGGFIYKIIIN